MSTDGFLSDNRTKVERALSTVEATAAFTRAWRPRLATATVAAVASSLGAVRR